MTRELECQRSALESLQALECTVRLAPHTGSKLRKPSDNSICAEEYRMLG